MCSTPKNQPNFPLNEFVSFHTSNENDGEKCIRNIFEILRAAISFWTSAPCAHTVTDDNAYHRMHSAMLHYNVYKDHVDEDDDDGGGDDDRADFVNIASFRVNRSRYAKSTDMWTICIKFGLFV